ncbi:MAG: hypothetical protein UX98_C0005G0029 [Parcubacteria group bacterium GW2011_GWA2_47_26]|nr:MAG: hypothetical protein UX98_C0005G0029 [Parcubacteria group bacterium GW2011_GWA2_47_26]
MIHFFQFVILRSRKATKKPVLKRTGSIRSLCSLRMTLVTLFIPLLLVLASSALPAFAEDTGAGAVRERLRGAGETGAGFTSYAASPAEYFGRIVRGALVLLGLVFFTLTVYGGILYLTASGNEDQVKKAKTILTRAIIGLIIVVFAGAITQFITGYVARPVTAE